MKKVFHLTLILSVVLQTYGHRFQKEEFQVTLSQSSDSPIIDGELNEELWDSSIEIKDFWEHFPSDTMQALVQTEIKITYDEKNLYIAAICHDDKEKNVIQSLKRDNNEAYWDSDGIAVIIDPNNKGTNGYIFAVNAAGAQLEGLISQNGEWYKMDVNWNNTWFSEVKHTDEGWVAEMAIPFKALSFNPSNHVWGINFLRNDMKRNVYSTWTQFSNNFQGIDLGYTGNFVIDELPESQRGNVILVPSTLGGVSENVEDNESIEYPANLSLDAKINLNSSLRLDITLNPDFSQVEVDEQVTNLSRFNPYFPEKRNFFLENSDLFSNLGTDEVRPIFTRKIGINDDGESIPILFGARISGNLAENSRIGIMNIQTGAKNDILAQNYTVATFQQSVLKRSTLKAFIANRQAIDETDLLRDDFNRIGGLEFDFTSFDSKWIGSLKYHSSETNDNFKDKNFYAGNFGYKGYNFSTMVFINKVNENYVSDIGFIPRQNNYDALLDTVVRLGYTSVFARAEYRFFASESSIVRHIRPRVFIDNYYNDDGSLNESNYTLANSISFKNKSWIFAKVTKNTTNLPFPITIINDSLLVAKEYQNDNFFIKYFADPRKKVAGEIFGMVGKFYDGMKYTYGGSINFRQQPWGKFSINYTQNNVQLGEKYGNKIFHLIGPKAEISFSRNISWTTFLQYNTQIDNFNINTRFQWRFRPMSDFYVVFTNNYNTLDATTRNYGVTFKINYWINI